MQETKELKRVENRVEPKIITDTPGKEEIRKLKIMKVDQVYNYILRLEGNKKKTSNPEEGNQ